MKKNKITIILPVYHEQENLQKVINGIEKYVKTPHTTLLVLQDKKDPTIPIAQKLQKDIQHVKILFTKNGKGMLKAIKSGLAYAKTSVVVIMMSDLSDNPKDIDRMIKKINEGCDLVCASRYSYQGKRIGGPALKGFLSYAACVTLRTLTKIPTNDATNAFKCFRKEVLNHIKVESAEGFAFPLELTVKMQNLGMKIGEVPTVWSDRKAGESQFNLIKNIPSYMRWYIFGIKSSFLKTWIEWSKKINKNISPSDHIYILSFSCLISVILYVICISLISIKHNLPETTAINWLTVYKYPKQVDYYLSFSLFAFVFLSSLIIWFLWVSLKSRK